MRPNWRAIGPAAVASCGLALVFILPMFVETFVLVDLTAYVVMSILALSLALVWGYGGMLCFGQSAFFGIGGYAYVIGLTNLGDSTIPLLLSIVLPMIVAALLGYFLFFGRVGDIYLGVITLCVSLILFNVINSTGAEFKIGSAAIGGNNGIPGIPPINFPGQPSVQLTYEGSYQLSLIVLVLVYVGLHLLLASSFGRLVVAIRSNELRVELLGYDARLYTRHIRYRRRHRRPCRQPICELGLVHRPDSLQHFLLGADHHLADGGRVGDFARCCWRGVCRPMAHDLAWRQQNCRSERGSRRYLYRLRSAGPERDSTEVG